MMHPLELMKISRMNKILAIIQAVPSAKLPELKEELFDKLKMSPKLANKYLQELEELNKITIDLDAKTVTAKAKAG